MVGVGDGGEGSKACLRTINLSYLILHRSQSFHSLGALEFVVLRQSGLLSTIEIWKEKCILKTLAIHWNLLIADVSGEARWQSPCGSYNRVLSHGNGFYAVILCIQSVFALMGKEEYWNVAMKKIGCKVGLFAWCSNRSAGNVLDLDILVNAEACDCHLEGKTLSCTCSLLGPCRLGMAAIFERSLIQNGQNASYILCVLRLAHVCIAVHGEPRC